MIDVGHVALGKFPGIWPVTGWPRYWALQYSWNTGHQPWLATPVMVVQAWARHRWHVALPVRQVNANTFKVGPAGHRDRHAPRYPRPLGDHDGHRRVTAVAGGIGVLGAWAGENPGDRTRVCPGAAARESARE